MTNRGRSIVRTVLQVCFVIALGIALHAWSTRGLLPANERTAAPPFELRDLEGRTWTMASLDGKPAVIYFFAPWCAVCQASAPQLRWFERWRGDEIAVLMVALDWATHDELRDYARRHELPMPVLIGDPAMASAYRVRGYPTYYILDRQGRIARRDAGITTVAGLWARTVGL